MSYKLVMAASLIFVQWCLSTYTYIIHFFATQLMLSTSFQKSIRRCKLRLYSARRLLFENLKCIKYSAEKKTPKKGGKLTASINILPSSWSTI